MPLLNKKESLLEIKVLWQETSWEDLANHHLNQVSRLVIAMLKTIYSMEDSMPSLVQEEVPKRIPIVR